MVNRNELDTGEYDLQELQRKLAGGSVGPPPSRKAPISIAFGALSHQGHVRPNNEDHFIVGRLCRLGDVMMTNLPESYVPRRLEQCAYAFAVADGMGGAAAGEVASSLALSLGTSLTLDASRWHLELDKQAAERLSERVNEFFRIIDRALTERARTDPTLTGMGTTLTVAYVVGLDALIFHIGDSRAYLWRRGALRQLTRDETLAQALADAGEISADAVANHPMRHILTRAMGAGSGGVEATIYPVRLEPDDCLLLCTDGLTDLVSDADIAPMLSRPDDPQQVAQGLVEIALKAGGHDNVTVIVARIQPG
jgi:protein phosphatase